MHLIVELAYILINKLNVHFHRNVLHVLSSWLAPRKANVCVNGKMSNELEMSNMIFQGTVLGPILWNLFFANAQNAVTDMNFESIVYADDLNSFKYYQNFISDATILSDLNDMQISLHS